MQLVYKFDINHSDRLCAAVGKVINADVNGALNIGRKVFGDSFMKSLHKQLKKYIKHEV